jgi:hypothetical protein
MTGGSEHLPSSYKIARKNKNRSESEIPWNRNTIITFFLSRSGRTDGERDENVGRSFPSRAFLLFQFHTKFI